MTDGIFLSTIITCGLVAIAIASFPIGAVASLFVLLALAVHIWRNFR